MAQIFVVVWTFPILPRKARARTAAVLASAANQAAEIIAMSARPDYVLNDTPGRRPRRFNTVLGDVVSASVVAKRVSADFGEVLRLRVQVDADEVHWLFA